MNNSYTISFFDAQRLHFFLGSDPSLIFHSSHVTDVAHQIISQFPSDITLNTDLILIGAFLHDIGRNKTQGIRHGLESSIIINENFPKSEFTHQLSILTSRHIGGGIPKNEAKALGLPEIDFIPETLEEKIVCYADKMVDYVIDKSKDAYQIIDWLTFNSVDNEIKKLSSRLGYNHPAISRLNSLEEDLLSYNNNKKFSFKNFSLKS